MPNHELWFTNKKQSYEAFQHPIFILKLGKRLLKFDF